MTDLLVRWGIKDFKKHGGGGGGGGGDVLKWGRVDTPLWAMIKPPFCKIFEMGYRNYEYCQRAAELFY